jgi:hypothetical protein
MMLEEDVLLSQWTRNAQECLSLKVGGRAMSSYRVDKTRFACWRTQLAAISSVQWYVINDSGEMNESRR